MLDTTTLTVEYYLVAGKVVFRPAFFSVGPPLGFQGVYLFFRADEAAFRGKLLAHQTIDLLADDVGGCGNPGAVALVFGRGVPRFEGGLGQSDIREAVFRAVRCALRFFRLNDVVADVREGGGYVAGDGGVNGDFQFGGLLADDLVHLQRFHAAGLELGEGFAGIDGV